MKQIRVWASRLHTGPFTLDSEAGHYLTRVHRLPLGADVELFDPDLGQVARATLVSAPKSGEGVEVLVTELEPAVERILPLTLLTCLGKGDKPEQALREATVLGARRVILVESARVQGWVQGSGGERELQRQRKVMLDAARQSGRVSIPEVLGPRPLLECLPSVSGRKLVLSLSPHAAPLLVQLEGWDAREELALLVGPEGGLTAEEERELEAVGFLAASLGPLVLRAETAVTVALGVVRAASLLARPG
jgi:16S rRNA (uracil1498-N3)-methyltransferase